MSAQHLCQPAPRFLSTELTLPNFKQWFETNLPTLEAYFKQLHDEGAGPPDFWEWAVVQHECELIRVTVQPC